MQFTPQTDFPLTDEACRSATGRSLGEWYTWLDANCAPWPGRRALIERMYVGQQLPVWWAITLAVEYERHAGLKQRDGQCEGYGICVSKQISTSLAQLYGAWATAAELSHWLGADTVAEVAEGGTLSNADGDRGTFLRVRVQKDLRLRWEHPALSSATLVDVAFSDKGGGKCGVMVNHSRIQTRAEADGLRAGWQDALGRLKALLEA